MADHRARSAESTSADDAELVARIVRGDRVAFEQLMRLHNTALFRAARAIVRDDADAEDVLQEAYLSAYRHLPEFRGDARLSTWLTRIVINQALGRQRKPGKVVFLDEGLLFHEESAMADDCTPEATASRNELRRRLEAAIDLLPPIYRCVFILRAVADLSVEDTAASLRVSQDVVKTRYLRARAMLRRQLDGEGEAALCNVHDFMGARCDEVVREVLARLREVGVVRDQ